MNRQPPALDNKNFLGAIILSMLIIFGWQFFYVAPQQKQQEIAAQQQQATTEQKAGTAPAAAVAATVAPRDTVINATARIKIETADIDGTINLKGAALDDLKLKNYRETIDNTSPEIVLLSPSGTKDAYFVEHFLVPAVGSTVKVPDQNTVWTAPAGAVLAEGKPVILTWDNGAGVTFNREISIDDKFVFTIRQTVENKSAQQIAVSPYAHAQRQDTPHVAGWYVFFEGMLGVQNGKLTEVNYANAAKPEGAVKNESVGGWLGFTDKYWSTVLVPGNQMRVANTYQHARANERDVYQASYQATQPVVVGPGQTVSFEERVFAGPKVLETIKAVGAKYGIDNFNFMIDWGWFWFLTIPMHWLLSTLQSIFGNFGIAILLATVLVKAALFPLANKSYASMSKMKKLQPEMERLKTQYPDDKVKMQQELMELYKKEKVSPLSGCLPVVIQIPIFFSLYKVILTSIDLRHAPFFGWIHDLSAPDPTSLFNLFGLLPFSVPTALMIGIWPLIMGVTMWVQMRLNPAPADPIQASMFNWMPLIFTFTLGGFPAGLVIYWAWSNLLSIIQQSYIMKKNGVDVDILGNIRNSLPFLKKKPAA
jgi:YidC/Oxa1 family membrane protein insertase